MAGDDTTNSTNTENDMIPDSFVINDDGSKSLDIVITCGMTFNTVEEVETLYASYAKSKGFAIRIRNSREKVFQLVCTREGVHKSKDEVGDSSNQKSRRFTKSSKIGCGASLHCGLNMSTKMWHITKFDDRHNHDMVTPKSQKYLRTHKKVTKAARVLSEVFESQGIPVGRVPNVLNASHGDVAFTKKDCYNHITGMGRKLLDDGDANAVYQFCTRQQQENPDFHYTISIDNDGRLNNFFWVDARSRKAYEIFGDVVSFDTTYRTNKYNMPFAPFVGINNHMQTTLFGYALLQDETEESFVWLFEAWLQSMDGKHPISFVTDQDKAMMNAVAKVFPTTKHRLCLWHIIKKFPERLAHIYHERSTFKTELNRCIHESISPQYFEEAWERLVIDYNLTKNDWLQDLYDMRHLWVPCYNKNVFFGGMNTTGRSESINAYFDAYIKSGMTLKELVLKCEEAIDNRYEVFRRAEFDSKHKVPILTLNMPLEIHASTVYTCEIFKLFCNELKGILGLAREKINEESTRQVYEVVDTLHGGRTVRVIYDTSTKETSCECMLFEFKGILCKHVLSIFYVNNVQKIPSSYIMNRWTKYVADPIFACKVVSRLESRKSLRSFELKETIDGLCDVCELSFDAFKYVKEGMDTLLMSSRQKFCDVSYQAIGNERDNNYSRQNPSLQIHDPNVTQTKGRKRASKSKDSRIRGGLEEAVSNNNRCSNCNGGGHNKRTCPNLRNQI